jgi:SAM-dependent methyltransferase
MDLFKSCLRAEVFDYVFSNGVRHHTANAFGGFQDLCRVLRPGGFIVIGLYNTYGRLLLDLRRLLFRINGDRLTWLDYFMRRKTLGDGGKADLVPRPVSQSARTEVLRTSRARVV